MQLFFPLDKLEELNNALYSKSHTISVLAVSNVKYCSTALHFICEKWEVHPVGCDKKGGIIDAANEQIKFIELLIYKCGSLKFNRVI